MSTITIGNNRQFLNMTEEDVKELFSLYAELKIKRTVIAAKYQAEIDTLNKQSEAETAPMTAEMERIHETILNYSLVHRDRYEKVRTITTPKGKIKMTKTTQVDVTDDQKVIDYSDANGLALYKTKKTVSKDAVGKYYQLTGIQVPGARVIAGDSVSLAVDQKLIDEATK